MFAQRVIHFGASSGNIAIFDLVSVGSTTGSREFLEESVPFHPSFEAVKDDLGP